MSTRGSNYPTRKIKDLHNLPENAVRVYWARLDSHTDMTTQGYIGITKQPLRLRVSGHLYTASQEDIQYVFARAIRKYGSKIEYNTIAVLSYEEASALEKRLRPHDFIGWNTVQGGLGNGTRLSEYTATEEFRNKRSSHMSNLWEEGGEHLDKILASRKAYYETVPSWDRRGASGEWKLAADLYTLMTELEWGLDKAANYLMLGGVRTRGLGKKLVSGWNPLEDEEYLTKYSARSLEDIEEEFGHAGSYHQSYKSKQGASTWRIADKLHEEYVAGKLLADIARDNGFTYHQYYKMHYKFQKGWVPLKDPRWIKWREELDEPRHNTETAPRTAN